MTERPALSRPFLFLQLRHLHRSHEAGGEQVGIRLVERVGREGDLPGTGLGIPDQTVGPEVDHPHLDGVFTLGEGSEPVKPVRSLPKESRMLAVHEDIRHVIHFTELDPEAVRHLFLSEGERIGICRRTGEILHRRILGLSQGLKVIEQFGIPGCSGTVERDGPGALERGLAQLLRSGPGRLRVPIGVAYHEQCLPLLERQEITVEGRGKGLPRFSIVNRADSLAVTQANPGLDALVGKVADPVYLAASGVTVDEAELHRSGIYEVRSDIMGRKYALALTTLDEKKSSDGPPWALVGEKFALFPTLSIYGGYPEYISADAGFEFAFMSGYSSIVAYDLFAQTEIGTNFGNVDFRFCGGLGMALFGLFSIQGGGGVELSPNKEPQSFGELMARFIFVNVKCIFTAPENGGSEPDTRYYLGISLGLLMLLMK